MPDKITVQNEIKLGAFTFILGAAAGAIIWVFMAAVRICTDLIWNTMPEITGASYITVLLCVAAGFFVGLVRKRFGDYPEELEVIIEKIKKNGRYDYRPIAVILICSFIPLVIGASVGPEAGLTAIIAGLCYWVGDSIKYAGGHAREYSDIGAAVTLGSLFHVPLFGIFAVEDVIRERGLDKAPKYVLYGVAVVAAFLVTKLLDGMIFEASLSFPSFSTEGQSWGDYLAILVYIPLGLIIYYLYECSGSMAEAISTKIPPVIREAVAGLAIGIISLAAPVILFSGEEQLAELAEGHAEHTALMLIGICFAKVVLTAFCIRLGLKGGHFFPLIYACCCMGSGVAMIMFNGMEMNVPVGAFVMTSNAVFAGAVVTASALGAEMKKPVAVTLLLMICFPIRLSVWILLASAISSRVSSRLSSKFSGKV